MKHSPLSKHGMSTTIGVVAIVIALIVGVAGTYALSSGKTVTSTAISTTTAVSTTTAATATVTSTVTTTASSVSSVAASTVAQAQAECAGVSTCFTIYSTIDASDWASTVAPAFYHAFPWAQGKLSFVSLNGNIVTQIISAYQAHSVTADFILANTGFIESMILAGAIQNYTSPMITYDNYSSDAYTPYWVTVTVIPDVIIYNPSIIKASAVPQNWQALANSQYKGQIAMTTPWAIGEPAAAFYYLYKTLGNTSGSWNTLMKQISANAVLTTNGKQALSDVETGQVGMCLCLYGDYLGAVSANQPVNYIAFQPTLYIPLAGAIAKNGPHPAMAELVEDWLLSYSGQYAMGLTQRAPYLSTISDQLNLVPANRTLYFPWDPTFLANVNTWSTTFLNLFNQTG